MMTEAELGEIIKDRLSGRPLVTVFQGEPYLHIKTATGVTVIPQIGGAAAAIEPVVRAARGLWVAWGRGDADRYAVDTKDRIKFPPEDPRYTLRRLWIHRNDIDRWYYGFSNSALWPLSHVAHVRPVFIEEEWESYSRVNRVFARETAEEIGDKDAVVWIHDYQLALVPQYLREHNKNPNIGLFWHIPWPVREIFRICPWRKEILEGMLGADLIGFHIQSYVLAFLATVARELEAKVDFDAQTVEYKGRLTRVQEFPISIDAVAIEQQAIRNEAHSRGLIKNLVPIPHRFLALSVDRLDYTKGIIERLRGVDRFLEKYPHYRGQFTFLMIQSSSRTRIPVYQDLRRDALDLAERINFKYSADVWSPVYFLERSLSPKDLYGMYRNADLLVVSSIHDGMNLVAKEYVAAANPKNSRLILSEFAGAAKELTEAILINPYDPDNIAEALKAAIEMSPKEREARMEAMKQQVRENNIYKWASSFLTALTNIEKKSKRKA